MRKTIIAGAAVTATLALAGTAQADTNVPSLTDDWAASNSTVNKVVDGVHFGTYADAGAVGGSLMWSGANGRTLAQVNDYSFTFNYRQAGNATGAAPYARIFLDSDRDGATDTDVMLDPSLGGAVMPMQSTDLSFGTADDSVRYGDDAGASAQQSWAAVKAAHGSDVITNVLVSQGNSMGTDVSAMLKRLTFNGETFNFTTPPADGSDGANGKDGVTGPAGKDGVTTIIRENGVIGGASIRILHVRKISGMKFVSAKATLGGKKLNTVKRRTIKVDLRNKAVGKYVVRITAKYQAGGKTYKVRSLRSLSIIRK